MTELVGNGSRPTPSSLRRNGNRLARPKLVAWRIPNFVKSITPGCVNGMIKIVVGSVRIDFAADMGSRSKTTNGSTTNKAGSVGSAGTPKRSPISVSRRSAAGPDVSPSTTITGQARFGGYSVTTATRASVCSGMIHLC